MSKTEKSEPGRVVQTENENKNVSFIRCAPRLLAIVKGVSDACGMPMIGPPQGLDIPTLPTWAENICTQLSKTIFKRLLELRPQDDNPDWRNLGRMLGAWQRIITFLSEAWKEIECVPPEQTTAPPQAPADSFVLLPEADLLAAMQESLTATVTNSLAQNPVEQSEFFAGLGEGHEMFLDTNGQFSGDRGRTKVYLELLGRWMEIEAMRQSTPPKTCLDLYALFAPSLGDPQLQHFEWFFTVCKEIGLGMKAQGRPRK